MRTGIDSTTFTAAIMVVMLFVLAASFSARGAEFTVTSSFDANDLNPGNGHCVAFFLPAVPGFLIPFCTLRAAIEEANSLPGPDIINIPAGIYQLTIAGINEDEASSGDLDITDSLLIRGNGAGQTFIDGNGQDRVFDVPSPDTDVVLEHLTVMNGFLPPQQDTSRKGGGGIRNRGNLTLVQVAVEDNQVSGSDDMDAGGGIWNESSLVLSKSSIHGNKAVSGGGVYNKPGAVLSIAATTIYNNTSSAGGALTNEGTAMLVNATISGNKSSSYSGGGIFNTSDMEILQSTITANSSPGAGGGLSNAGTIRMANTIVAGNTPDNCHLPHPLDSLGNYLSDDASCLLASRGDISNTDPKLVSLQDHGGPTLTHGLFIGSPAVDSGQDLSFRGITVDQRGIKRPDGDAFDIGAFETRRRSVVPLFSPFLSRK